MQLIAFRMLAAVVFTAASSSGADTRRVRRSRSASESQSHIDFIWIATARATRFAGVVGTERCRTMYTLFSPNRIIYNNLPMERYTRPALSQPHSLNPHT